MRSTNSSRHLQPRSLAMKTLLSVGAAATALAVCDQAWRWTVTTVRASAVATLSALFMTASMSAQTPAAAAHAGTGSPAQIRTVADSFTRAVVAGDARAVAALFAPDGYELPPAQPAVKGRASIEQRYRAFFSSGVKVTSFTLTPIASSIAGDVAYDVGVYEQHLSLPDGKAATDVGKYVVILKRTQGEWKAAYSTYNSDTTTPPCAGN
jgi:uncharacterized protein (TIGR02246 family)